MGSSNDANSAFLVVALRLPGRGRVFFSVFRKKNALSQEPTWILSSLACNSKLCGEKILEEEKGNVSHSIEG